jgi:hypothetical protein
MTQMDGAAYDSAAAAAIAAGSARPGRVAAPADEDEDGEGGVVAAPVPKVQRPPSPVAGVVTGR